MEEVERNPGLTVGLRIEEVAERGEGGSNLTADELGIDADWDVDVDVDADLEIGNEDEDEITWESDSDDDEEGEHELGEKDEDYIESSNSSDSDSGSDHSDDSGYDDTTARNANANADTNMDTGPQYDEGFVEGGDAYNGSGSGAGDGYEDEINWNDMSNDNDLDPYAGSARPKVAGESDVQMGFGGDYGEWENDAEWDGVEALEPEEDEAVDGYEGTGDGARRSEDDVWWLER